jgi:hypothetical protein
MGNYDMAEERAAYVPPPYPDCGSENTQVVEWIPAPDWSGRTTYILGPLRCRHCGNLQPPAS